MTDFFVSRF